MSRFPAPWFSVIAVVFLLGWLPAWGHLLQRASLVEHSGFTAIAEDAAGRRDTNSVMVWLPNAATFAYDASGNLTNDGRRSFFYDPHDRLESVQVAGALFQ